MAIMGVLKGSSGGGIKENTGNGNVSGRATSFVISTGIPNLKMFRLKGTISLGSLFMEYDADDPTIYNSCMYYGSTGEAYGNKQTIGSYISGTYGQNMTKVESIDTNGDVTLVTANVSDTRYTNITAYEWYAVG